MKRLLASALMIGVASCFGLAGCGEESKVKTSETVSGPGGTTTTTNESKVKSTGENPPPSTTGETGGTAAPAK